MPGLIIAEAAPGFAGLPLLQERPNRDLLLEVLEQVRRRYRFVVVGYVVMPEHPHLLLSEPERGDPSKVMQALKQGFARRRPTSPFAIYPLNTLGAAFLAFLCEKWGV